MSLGTLMRSFVALSMLLGTAYGVDARQSLTEEELDQTMAGGIEYRIVGDETETVAVDDDPDLFFNEFYGQNEVITRVVVQIVASMHRLSFTQANRIDQDGELADIGALAGEAKNIVLVVKGPNGTDGSKFIAVNNVAGGNEVETAIGLTFFVPVGRGGAVGGYTNPFAGSGGPRSTPTTGATNAPTAAPSSIPTPAPQNNFSVPQFERPTTLEGGVSLMQGLAQQNPAAASGLQQGISTIQSLQR